MFDFLESDWFNIALEIIFLILIIYDVRRYRQTKKGEFLVNIFITVGFAIWTLYPYYNSYIGWESAQKEEILKGCESESNTTLCRCVNETIFKEYTYANFQAVDKNSAEYKEFLKEVKEDCSDNGWF